MRPKLTLLSEQQKETIPGEAMETLATVGMLVECEDALALCRDAGLRADGERVLLERGLHDDRNEGLGSPGGL